MLDESLENFLESCLPAELYKLYVDIIGYLESIEYETIQAELLDIMYSSLSDDNEKLPKPESTICDEINVHLHEVLTSQLSVLGVTVDENAKLKDMYDLSVGISHITSHEDIASIIASASNDSDSVDQLAEILQLVTTQPSVVWVMMLDTVSDDLIKRIRELSVNMVDAEYQEMEESAEYLAALRMFAAYVAQTERKLIVLEMVGSLVLGQPFETYINSGYLNDLFDSNEMHTLALELYGFALMSSDAKHDPIGAVRNIIEKYIGDSGRIVKLNVELNLVNAQYIKYFQTNSKGLSAQNGQA